MDFSHVLKLMLFQKEEEKVVKDLVNKKITTVMQWFFTMKRTEFV